jgi:hypothetical protein
MQQQPIFSHCSTPTHSMAENHQEYNVVKLSKIEKL